MGEVPLKPFACYSGDLPYGINQIEGYCDENTALQQYSKTIESFQKECEHPHTCDKEEKQSYYLWSDKCKERKETCDVNHFKLPVIAKSIGAFKIKHPMFRIITHLDTNGVDDFRSAEVFEKAANNPGLINAVKKNKSLTILYPASGSHMATLLIGMKMIDRGDVNKADMIYTEIDESAIERIKEYLQWYALPQVKLIENLNISEKTFEEGREVYFKFSYRGKPVSLTFALNRGGDVWARDEYIKKSNLIIFHDGVYNTLQSKDFNIANRFLDRVQSIVKGDKRKRFILSENQWGCREITSGKNRGKSVCSSNLDMWNFAKKITYLKGFYGCGSVSKNNPTYKVLDDKIRKTNPRQESKMKKHHIHTGPNPDVKNSPALLIEISPR